jgi:parallel beta-helix repeat protein
MKKILPGIILISTISFAQYSTPGTGMEWNLDSIVIHSGGAVSGTFPDYTATTLITISENDKLTILPGSILIMADSLSGFEINGALIAKGTSADSIIVTSSNQDSTGSYEGFRFNDSSIDSLCEIEYAKIEYARNSFRCVNSNPSLKNSYIYKCRVGARLSFSNANILYNRIEKSYEWGITLTQDSSPLIEGNELVNNNTENAGAKNQITIGTQGNNSPTVIYNKIHGSSNFLTGGISVAALFPGSSSSSEIAYNEIYNNSFGIALVGGTISCYIHNNKIYNNNINPDVNVSGSGINVNGNAFNSPIITRNEIYGNWWGITIQNGTTVQAGPEPNIGNIENGSSDDDGWNIIYNNIQGADTFDLYNNCTNEIYAQNNDWRVYDSLSIEQHIFHQADDIVHGLIKFIPFSDFIPVELISFTACTINNNVLLEWETASEKNNIGFEVERINGKWEMEKGKWERAGFVKGNETSTENKKYSFTDKNLQNGNFKYRLKQIDYDGTFNYSKIVEVEIKTAESFSLKQNYPNPFNPSTNISFQVAKPGFVSLIVYDILGRKVAELVKEELTDGSYEIAFNASELSSGIYFYKLEAGEFTSIKKMLLLR